MEDTMDMTIEDIMKMTIEDVMKMEDGVKMIELYYELKSKFNQVDYCCNTFVSVYIYDTLWVEFRKSSKDYSFQYDIIENYKVLEEFLMSNGHEIFNYGFCTFHGENTEITLRRGDIALCIFKDLDNIIDIYFTKIYDLIDYLKDYFNLQNKVAIRE